MTRSHNRQHAGEIPSGAVVRRRLISDGTRGDDVVRLPSVVLHDATGGISHRQANLVSAVEHLGGPVDGDFFGSGNILHHVVFQMPATVDRLKRSGHHREQSHLLGDQLTASERRKIVGGRIEQSGKVGGETDLNDHHRPMSTSRQRLPQDGDSAGCLAALEVVGVARCMGVLLVHQRQKPA